MNLIERPTKISKWSQGDLNSKRLDLLFNLVEGRKK
jgi:hypothetical protein